VPACGDINLTSSLNKKIFQLLAKECFKKLVFIDNIATWQFGYWEIHYF
jgi:hypothetical protein